MNRDAEIHCRYGFPGAVLTQKRAVSMDHEPEDLCHLCKDKAKPLLRLRKAVRGQGKAPICENFKKFREKSN